jgi:hypothetical protein
MDRRLFLVGICGVATAVVLGCSDHTLSPSPDPAGVQYLWTPCVSVQSYPYDPNSGWYPERPKAANALFDVFLGSRDAILASGGQIVHEFNLPVIRAHLPVSAVPTLQANFVQSVEGSPNEFTLSEIVVGFLQPSSTDDADFLLNLGAASVAEIYPGSSSYLVRSMPDEAIPAIRANSRVRYVELNLVACPD